MKRCNKEKISVKCSEKIPSSGKSLISTYSISNSISLSLKSINEFSGAASSMSDIVTSANGLVAPEADTAYLSLSGKGRGKGSGWALIRGWAPINVFCL